MEKHEIPNFWTGNCFGCSRTNTNGLQLRFWRTDQGCLTKCIIPDYLCGFDGIVHGGIIATLLDEVGAWTIISSLGRFGITREISIHYLKPVPINTEIIAEGRVISQDEKNAVLHTNIHSIDRALLAEGESKWVFARLSTIANLSGFDEPTLKHFLERSSQREEKNQR